MAAIRRALEEEFDAVGEEGHACEAEMEDCIGGAYGPDDDADAHEGSSDSDSDTEPPNVMDARAARRQAETSSPHWPVARSPSAAGANEGIMTPPTPQQQRGTAVTGSPQRKASSDLRKRLASKRFAQRAAGLRVKQFEVVHRVAPRPSPSTAANYGMPSAVLTPFEKRVVLQQRTLAILSTLAGGIGAAASMQVKLGLVDHNVGKMATATGQLISMISGCNLVLGPVVAALSDRFGRLPCMYLSILARLGWSINLLSITSIERYQEAGVLAFGLAGAGASSVQQAALDDLFGLRPHLSAQIQAKNSAWTACVGLLAPIVGAEIGRRSVGLALVLSAAIGALQLPVLMLSKETLKPEQRKPFALRTADPIRNMGLLFRNGGGLRRLAFSQIFFTLCTGVQQTLTSFQVGSLGWSTADQSYYGSFQSLLGLFSQGSVVMPMLKRLGPRGAFETGSLFSTVGYLLLSQAWRPLGASKVHKTLQLAAAMLLMVPGRVCGLAMRTMVVKQASEVTKAGRGELNAALSGLESLIGVVMPLAWGFLTKTFAEAGVGKWWYNPGGQFMIAAALRLVARQVVVTTPEDQLRLGAQ